MGNENSNSQYMNNFSYNISTEKSDNSLQYKEIMKFKKLKRIKSDTASTSYIPVKNITDNSILTSNSEFKTKEDLIIEKKDDRVPYKFEWKEGGNKVTITGSFLTNWTVFIDMVKNPETGFFEFNINLPREVHQFKFIVDNIWKCSINYFTTNDGNGNVNNVIDLTNYIPPEDEKEIEMEKEAKSQIEFLKRENEIRKRINYEFNCCFLDEDDMNIEAPIIPSCFKKNFNINCIYRSSDIGKKKYLNYIQNNILSDNCYKRISKLPHVVLNHCYSSSQENINERYVRSCVSKRFKHKVVTIVYYKPKRNCYI